MPKKSAKEIIDPDNKRITIICINNNRPINNTTFNGYTPNKRPCISFFNKDFNYRKLE
jgi:hypothetical protein